MSDKRPHRLMTELLTEIREADLQIDPPEGWRTESERWDRDATARAPASGGTADAWLARVLCRRSLPPCSCSLVHRSSRGPIAVGHLWLTLRSGRTTVKLPAAVATLPAVGPRPSAIVPGGPEEAARANGE
jgi:hypothetical protein